MSKQGGGFDYTFGCHPVLMVVGAVLFAFFAWLSFMLGS